MNMIIRKVNPNSVISGLIKQEILTSVSECIDNSAYYIYIYIVLCVLSISS